MGSESGRATTIRKVISRLEGNLQFVMLHEPVIPVNERCWHVFRQDNAKREQLLQIIASQQAIVLCAHLHLYSVVCRDTPWGPIVQILVNSVIKDKNMLVPKNVVADYGPEFCNGTPTNGNLLLYNSVWNGLIKKLPISVFSNKWIYRATASFLLTKKTTRCN